MSKCKENALCPQCKEGYLKFVEYVERGGFKYPVYNCPRCGFTCRDEDSPKR
jgi:rubrerythrin